MPTRFAPDAPAVPSLDLRGFGARAVDGAGHRVDPDDSDGFLNAPEGWI